MRNVAIDEVLNTVAKLSPKVLRCSLTQKDKKRLRAAFSPDTKACQVANTREQNARQSPKPPT